MKRVRGVRWLVSLVGLATACSSGSGSQTVIGGPWANAVPLSTAEQTPNGVVSDGTNVYYTTGLNQAGDNALRVAPLTPASPPASHILVSNPGAGPTGGTSDVMALDGGDIYIGSGLGIVRVSTATGVVTRLVDLRPTGVTSLAVDDRFVWWTTANLNSPTFAEVARIPKAGGPVEILGAGTDKNGHVYQDDPARLAVAVPGSHGYNSILLDGDAALFAWPGGIMRTSPGHPPTLVADDKKLGGPPTNLVADADRIYGEAAGDSLFALPRSGGAPVKLVPHPNDTAKIVVSGNEILFFTDSSGGRDSLNAIPTTGGRVRVISSGHYSGGDLAVTGDRVVFSADGRVWSAPLRGA